MERPTELYFFYHLYWFKYMTRKNNLQKLQCSSYLTLLNVCFCQIKSQCSSRIGSVCFHIAVASALSQISFFSRCWSSSPLACRCLPQLGLSQQLQLLPVRRLARKKKSIYFLFGGPEDRETYVAWRHEQVINGAMWQFKGPSNTFFLSLKVMKNKTFQPFWSSFDILVRIYLSVKIVFFFAKITDQLWLGSALQSAFFCISTVFSSLPENTS